MSSIRQAAKTTIALSLAVGILSANAFAGRTIMETSEKAPDRAYIPLLSGAELLTKTPERITTKTELAVAAAANKFVGITERSTTGDSFVLRAMPDENVMHPYNVALGVEKPASAADLRASLAHVSSIESGEVTAGDATMKRNERIAAIISIPVGLGWAYVGTAKDSMLWTFGGFVFALSGVAGIIFGETVLVERLQIAAGVVMIACMFLGIPAN